MLFGIRGQLTIVVIMLVSSTGFTWALACVYTHINVHTRTRASPTTSQKQYDEENKCWYHPQNLRAIIWATPSEDSKDRGS